MAFFFIVCTIHLVKCEKKETLMGKKAGEKRMYTRVHVVEQNICPSRKICFLLLLCRTATTTVNDKHEAYYE